MRQEGEEILHDAPQDFIVLRPYTYAVIADPVILKDGQPLKDKHGSVRVRNGEQEIRTDKEYSEPFPLYPGEVLKKVDNLTVVPRDYALKVKANRAFIDLEGKKREAGDEWMIKGPTIYVPRIEEDKVQLIQPLIIVKNTAIKLRAKLDCLDYYGAKRAAGEEWLVRDQGNYLLGINEVMVEVVAGIVLTETKALQMMATKTFKDIYGKERKAGEEWLVTNKYASVHICDVNEKTMQQIDITVLQNNEYCYLLNPLENGLNQMGKKILVKGPIAFFLNPGEALDGGIKKNYILSDDEGLLMKAVEKYTDPELGEKRPGDWWMVHGPRNYVPAVEVAVVELRKAIPLDTIEGVYIRDYNTGVVRAVSGQTYMLKAEEELAKKDVPDVVSELLRTQGHVKDRKPYSVVTFKVPYNNVVQIYDYKQKKSRVVFGPDLVMLNPDEQFTVNYLSGGTPKVPGRIKALSIALGPTFSTDKIEQVETSDHARLELKLSYNWYFRVQEKEADGPKIFNVRDFIGDMCSSMASRIRASVATLPFDHFHKSSARTIRKAIFGVDPTTNKIIDDLFVESNNLVIFNVDIQSAEPMDKKTKESLQKTVTQAIEITTKMQEQEARRQAGKIEQEEKGKLDCLILENRAMVEEAKRALLGLKAESDGVKSKGQAIAEARAKAQADEIAAKADVVFADHQAQAKKVREMAEIEHMKELNRIELEHQKQMSLLKILKTEELAKVESGKFKSVMDSIGQQTLVDIARAGPETQSNMLSSLGLQGYMLMDSKNPINLFTAANGMVSGAGASKDIDE